MESLREECAELHRREAAHAEQCQRDAEVRVQAELAHFSHLPAEINSLKVVMEMKGEEIKVLRTKNMEQMKQVRRQNSWETFFLCFSPVTKGCV